MLLFYKKSCTSATLPLDTQTIQTAMHKIALIFIVHQLFASKEISVH